MMCKKIIIEVYGESEADIEDGFCSVIDSISNDNTLGCDQTEIKGYSFSVVDAIPPALILESDDDICCHCNGSGEGRYEGNSCGFCVNPRALLHAA